MLETRRKDEEHYEFYLKANSGNTLLKSVPFRTEKKMDIVLNQLKKDKIQPFQIERKTNYAGKFLFKLHTTKGFTIGESGLYDSEAGMENGIKNLFSSIAEIP